MIDWQASRTSQEQGADINEIPLNGKINQLSFSVVPKSSYWRAGFKLVDPNGAFLPLLDKSSLVFHLGSTDSEKHYGLTAYRDGQWVDTLNKTMLYTGKPIKVNLEINDKNFIKVTIDGSIEFKPDWHLTSPNIREKVALIAWGDDNDFTVRYKDIDALDERGKRKIFYSWQSDIPRIRNYVQRCLEAAVKQVNGWEIESATRETSGSPDIGVTILSKIDDSDLLLADVSIINPNARKVRKCPNPNVVYELGYAVKSLTDKRAIQIADKTTTKETTTLPFDIRNRRMIFEDFHDPKSKEKIIATLVEAMEKYKPATDINLSHPYIYMNGTSHTKWADGQTTSLNVKNDEPEAYYLEAFIMNGQNVAVGRNLDPATTTPNVPATGLPVPPFDVKYESIEFTVSRSGDKYKITQKLNLSKRADNKYNFDSFDPRPFEIQSIT